MTARLIFEATLIELNKIQAPSLKLYEFNYLFNKAVSLYVNKVYNFYDLNQLTTDDLRVLKSTAYLTPKKVVPDNRALHNPSDKFPGNANSYLSKAHSSILSLYGATYEVFLPLDYLHMLNCICVYYVSKQKDCWDEGSYILIPATRLVSDSWSQIMIDIYNRPSPMKPYYYIHNSNTSNLIPTNARTNYDTDTGLNEIGTDLSGEYKVTSSLGEVGDNSNFLRIIKLKDNSKVSLVEKPIASRIGNVSNIRCEVRYGMDDTLFLLAEVQIDYIKCPLFIRLTQELLDLTEDTSQMMEFPDYVNQEIINELVHLVMERSSDPRLNTNMLITPSIARPTEQLQKQ